MKITELQSLRVSQGTLNAYFYNDIVYKFWQKVQILHDRSSLLEQYDQD